MLGEVLLGLPVFALVLFRVGGLVLTAPVFGSSIIPVRVRAAFTMVIALMIFPLASAGAPTGLSLGGAVVGGVIELMVGATIGLSLSVFLLAAEVAGHTVGQQAGLALGQIVDPSRNERSSLLGQVYTISLTTLFLLVGGHRATVAALLDTYEVIPVLSYTPGDSFALLMIEMLTAAFMLGLRVSGPVVIALFLIGVALAFLSRTMPQLNILTVGFSIRALVALGTAGIALSVCCDVFHSAIWDALTSVRAAFGVDANIRYMVN